MTVIEVFSEFIHFPLLVEQLERRPQGVSKPTQVQNNFKDGFYGCEYQMQPQLPAWSDG